MLKYRVCISIINQKWAPVSTLMTLGFHKASTFFTGLLKDSFPRSFIINKSWGLRTCSFKLSTYYRADHETSKGASHYPVQVRMYQCHIVIAGHHIAQCWQPLLNPLHTNFIWQRVLQMLQLCVCGGVGNYKSIPVSCQCKSAI